MPSVRTLDVVARALDNGVCLPVYVILGRPKPVDPPTPRADRWRCRGYRPERSQGRCEELRT